MNYFFIFSVYFTILKINKCTQILRDILRKPEEENEKTKVVRQHLGIPTPP